MWACGVEWGGVVLRVCVGRWWGGGCGWVGGGWGRVCQFSRVALPDHFPPLPSPLSNTGSVFFACALSLTPSKKKQTRKKTHHVERVLIDPPRVALEFDRAVHRLPVGGVQLGHVGNGRAFIDRQRRRPIEQPHKPSLLLHRESISDRLLRPVTFPLRRRHIQDAPIRREAPPVVGTRDGGLRGAIVILDLGHPAFGQRRAAVHTRVRKSVHFPRLPVPEQHQVLAQRGQAHGGGADLFGDADAVPKVFEVGFAPLELRRAPPQHAGRVQLPRRQPLSRAAGGEVGQAGGGGRRGHGGRRRHGQRARRARRRSGRGRRGRRRHKRGRRGRRQRGQGQGQHLLGQGGGGARFAGLLCVGGS